MSRSSRRSHAQRHRTRKQRMTWSDDPHEDFVINCLAVLYDAAAKFTGGVLMGVYLLVLAIARLLWSAMAGIVAQDGKDRSHVTREQASKGV